MKAYNRDLLHTNSELYLNNFFNTNEVKIKNYIRFFLNNMVSHYSTYEVDDIFQEVALKIIKNNYIKKFISGKSSLNTWLSIISRTVAIDYIRKIQRNDRKIDEFKHEETSEKEKINIEIPPGILTERQTQIIRMSFWEDLKAVEIAEKLQVTPRTIRSIKYQALSRLRKHYEVQNNRRTES